MIVLNDCTLSQRLLCKDVKARAQAWYVGLFDIQPHSKEIKTKNG